MKLKNKKTGEIIELLAKPSFVKRNDDYLQSEVNTFNSLAELNAEWEDYEEPKEYWYIDYDGGILCGESDNSSAEKMMISIGNHFNSLEEAEKAVEKLKAWKRMKDDGLKIRKYELNGGTDRNGCFTGDICLTLDISKPVYEDILQLLFGGEE